MSSSSGAGAREQDLRLISVPSSSSRGDVKRPRNFCNNSIQTAKYSYISFIPMYAVLRPVSHCITASAVLTLPSPSLSHSTLPDLSPQFSL